LPGHPEKCSFEARRLAEARNTHLPIGVKLIILGIILLIIGIVAHISIILTIGIIVLVIGLVLALLGMTGRAVGGRRHYF
jgi:uncharacterized membrane protein HdeD (DUF308 family)